MGHELGQLKSEMRIASTLLAAVTSYVHLPGRDYPGPASSD